jgi:enterochelin esterase family protein
MNKTERELEGRFLKLMKGGGDMEDRRRSAGDFYRDVTAHGDLPFAIGNHAYFFYHGTAKNVSIAGDWTYWQMAAPLKRIEGTDLFYSILEFPKTARLQYKLVVDGEWILDPANRRVSEEGFGVNSEFWMPDHVDPSALWRQTPAERGRIERYEIHSEELAEQRELFLYTPHRDSSNAGSSATPLPLLIVHDGAEALHIGRFHLILDNLIAAGRIAPTAALFIPPRNRNYEYAFNDRYIRYCSEEALPFAIETLKGQGVEISEDAADRCVLGASLGGLLSTMTLIRYPDVMGSCIAQSPAYWPNRGEIFRSPYLANARDLKVILQTGTICDARELAGIMRRRLQQLGADVVYQEFQQGHTWGNWRSNLASALEEWIGPASGSSAERSDNHYSRAGSRRT